MTVDPLDFRGCLGQFATGVTVVSCRTHDGVHGATVNAFSAVSLDPPLVLVSLDRRSKVNAHLEGRPFAVTVLAAAAHPTALHFAGRAQEGLEIGWVDHEVAPRVAGGVAWLACRPWATYDGGDHVLHVGAVCDYAYHPEEDPLVFHAGRFRSLGDHLAVAPWWQTLDSPICDVDWWSPELALTAPAARPITQGETPA